MGNITEREELECWRWLVRHGKIGFSNSCRSRAYISVPLFDTADETIPAIVMRAVEETKDTA